MGNQGQFSKKVLKRLIIGLGFWLHHVGEDSREFYSGLGAVRKQG